MLGPDATCVGYWHELCGTIAHLQNHTADTLNLGLFPIDNLLQIANFLIKQLLLLS